MEEGPGSGWVKGSSELRQHDAIAVGSVTDKGHYDHTSCLKPVINNILSVMMRAVVRVVAIPVFSSDKKKGKRSRH